MPMVNLARIGRGPGFGGSPTTPTKRRGRYRGGSIGPASAGRRLSDDERKVVEDRLRREGLMPPFSSTLSIT